MDSSLSLYELNNLIKGVLSSEMSDSYWVQAEMSDVRVNQNGHCYLEFIEKDSRGKSVVAKCRGMIWANTFYMLRAYFESATKQTFASGLKILVKVSVEFHELYGLSLTVHDIDPSYTLGDQAMNRAMILKQLEEDGVLELNKELELPQPTNKIAVISSPTAAGYEDFCNQLDNNSGGYKFYTKLFPAIMQGDRAEQSISYALEKIYDYQDLFDAVVIIRGGGATSDLSCFDSYLLAASCAQFPLPVITGIGHERDETVLDIVAHTRAKTPTAVAEFLIGEMDDLSEELNFIEQNLQSEINLRIREEMVMLNTYENKTIFWLKNWSNNQFKTLEYIANSLKRAAKDISKNENNKLTTFLDTLNRTSIQIKRTEEEKLNSHKDVLRKNASTNFNHSILTLNSFEKSLELLSPKNVLKRGYSITLKNGKAVKSASELKKGDKLKTITMNGEVDSIVEK